MYFFLPGTSFLIVTTLISLVGLLFVIEGIFVGDMVGLTDGVLVGPLVTNVVGVFDGNATIIGSDSCCV